MNHTKIEWVKNPDGTQGYTWNPITGCLNGCDYCYARKLANGRLRKRYMENHPGVAAKPMSGKWAQAINDPFYPRFWPERVDELDISKQQYCQFKGGKGIFVCDMGELFGDWVPREWQDRIFEVIKMNWHHRFYLLTKQPQNLIKFSPFPENCWVGVTATNYEMANHARYYLKQVEAKVKYLSIEPLLSPLHDRLNCTLNLKWEGIDWVIIGAQTKPYKPPKIEWVEEISKACVSACIPLFLKDNLRPLLEPHHIVVRQEMLK